MKRFFGHPITLWPSMRNRLHIYALPAPDLRSALEERQRVLEAFDYCSVQPANYLHATVQQFAVTSDEVSPEDMDAFMARLKSLAADTKPFSIGLGEPEADDYSLGVKGTSTSAWAKLTAAVRDAAADTINKGQPLPGAPFNPHLTLGYALAEGSTALIQQASDQLRATALPPLAINEMHLIAVHQDAKRGTFTWDTTSRFPFSEPPAK
ncbi:2'-5' RNA ligase family protein [Arthrobacter sp. KNU40]|uniref:2'-5' RNA ligase family protein n=1 Tax=Arthrobacter sp. KNU40 TaxID=3447965 RepID=UPI003F61F10D